jgi:hypothetical protein
MELPPPTLTSELKATFKKATKTRPFPQSKPNPAIPLKNPVGSYHPAVLMGHR